MSFLESAKQYTGSDLETIFFRPILSGDSARELGVRVPVSYTHLTLPTIA